MFVRTSKFRHVFGNPAKKESCYEGLRVSKTANDSNLCAVNPLFLAVVLESSGGGVFSVLPINKIGRVDTNLARVSGHRAPITDLKLNPHHDHVIASASEDMTIKVWMIPEKGLSIDLTQWIVDLPGHTKKILFIEWHPTAEWVLLSAGADNVCIIWNTMERTILTQVQVHNDLIQSICWSYDGSCFATTCRDKLIRYVDARSGRVVSQGVGHQGNKISKVVCLKFKNHLFTTGFSKTGERQYALWDCKDLSKALKLEEVDASNGVIIPYADNDLNIIYLAGKGDGNIRYVEIQPSQPYIYFLNQYQSGSPQRCLGFMPKRGLDTKRCEVARIYKLHAAKDLCEPINMICPRKSDCFQGDIYPPTPGPEPPTTASEWFKGANPLPILINLETYDCSTRNDKHQNLETFMNCVHQKISHHESLPVLTSSNGASHDVPFSHQKVHPSASHSTLTLPQTNGTTTLSTRSSIRHIAADTTSPVEASTQNTKGTSSIQSSQPSASGVSTVGVLNQGELLKNAGATLHISGQTSVKQMPVFEQTSKQNAESMSSKTAHKTAPLATSGTVNPPPWRQLKSEEVETDRKNSSTDENDSTNDRSSRRSRRQRPATQEIFQNQTSHATLLPKNPSQDLSSNNQHHKSLQPNHNEPLISFDEDPLVDFSQGQAKANNVANTTVALGGNNLHPLKSSSYTIKTGDSEETKNRQADGFNSNTHSVVTANSTRRDVSSSLAMTVRGTNAPLTRSQSQHREERNPKLEELNQNHLIDFFENINSFKPNLSENKELQSTKFGGDFDAEDGSDANLFRGQMIDFISTEAPDDALIKPSSLRASMNSRQKRAPPKYINSPVRTGSLRELPGSTIAAKREVFRTYTDLTDPSKSQYNQPITNQRYNSRLITEQKNSISEPISEYKTSINESITTKQNSFENVPTDSGITSSSDIIDLNNKNGQSSGRSSTQQNTNAKNAQLNSRAQTAKIKNGNGQIFENGHSDKELATMASLQGQNQVYMQELSKMTKNLEAMKLLLKQKDEKIKKLEDELKKTKIVRRL